MRRVNKTLGITKPITILSVMIAPVFAAPTQLDTTAATVNSNNPGNYTVSSASDRRLVCFGRYNDPTPDLITAWDYGGESMTLVENHTAGANHHYLYELDESGIAAASDNTFSITYAPGTPVDFRTVFVCVSFQDAGQGAIAESNEDGANDDPLTVDITEAANSLGVSFCSVNHNNGTGDSHTWENDWIELASSEADSDDGDVTVSAATKALSSGTDTAQCNPTTGGSGSSEAYIVALRLDPANTGAMWFWLD